MPFLWIIVAAKLRLFIAVCYHYILFPFYPLYSIKSPNRSATFSTPPWKV